MMLDLTAGYDPTKPLLIERPLDYLLYTSLSFNRKENVTDYFIFYDGDPVEKKDYQLVFEVDMRENKLLELDVVPSIFSGVIASKKIVDILTTVCPSDFQVFPVTIKTPRGKRKSKEFVNHDYFLVHIIRNIDSLDLESSEFSLIDKSKPKAWDNVISPMRLRFKKNCMGDAHIAKHTTVNSVKFISQHLFHEFQRAHIKGAEFMPDYLCYYERSNYPELFRAPDNN